MLSKKCMYNHNYKMAPSLQDYKHQLLGEIWENLQHLNKLHH